MKGIRSYALVTGAYWGFTLTDGALRMLVVLHFYKLGYSDITIAFLFLFYEFFGIVTNLLGGWIASRSGLKTTLYGGLALQIFALLMLGLLQPSWARILSVAYVMAAQSPLRYCKGPDQNERQERRQVGGAGRYRKHPLQMGLSTYGFEERA